MDHASSLVPPAAGSQDRILEYDELLLLAAVKCSGFCCMSNAELEGWHKKTIGRPIAHPCVSSQSLFLNPLICRDK